MPGFQFYFELIGAVAFAISGAALAVKKHMDLFGVAMMGMTTAVGGGILRDLLLGITPPAALRDPLQALVAIATSLLVFLVWKRFHPEGDHRNWEALLLVADSIGLGIFSVHGAAVAIRAPGWAAMCSWRCWWVCSPAWAAVFCVTCAVWSAPTFSPSISTPARPWPARRRVCCCGAPERTWRC